MEHHQGTAQQIEHRRHGDTLLAQLITTMERLEESQKLLSDKVEKYLLESAQRRGEYQIRIANLEALVKRHEDDIDAHEKWINIATGKTAMLSLIFGAVGAFVMMVADHVIFKKGN